MERRTFLKKAGIGITASLTMDPGMLQETAKESLFSTSGDEIIFFDTCVRIGNSRAPDPPGNAADVVSLEAMMERHNIRFAAVEHAVAMEASPRLGQKLLSEKIAEKSFLWQALHLMPAVSPRIEKAYTDPRELITLRVALGRVDAKDFCQGQGDKAMFGPVLDACSRISLPVFIDFRRQGDVATFDFGICERYPRIPFVIEGFGGYPMHRVFWCLKNYPNLYLSTVEFRLFNGVRFICDEIGESRLIYGSDWPARSMGMSQGMVLLAGINKAQRAAIAGGNFLRLLDVVKKEGSKL